MSEVVSEYTVIVIVFVFKQKTTYEMRISDWSSDVCSSDLHRLEELKPGAAVQSDAELLAWVRQNAETAYHPVGSCRMGSDAEAVVDPQLRVRGVQSQIGRASCRARVCQYG